MFEKDISNLAKPEIKGRGFLQSGNEIIETQTYYTEPENDWVFDETQKMTYDNPVYIEQKKRKHETIDDSGFTVPKKLSDLDKDEIEDINEQEISTFNEEDDWEDDWDDDSYEVIEKPISFTQSVPKDENKDIADFMNEFEKKEESNKKDIINFMNDLEANNKVEDQPVDDNPVISFSNINNSSNEENTPIESQPTKKVIKFKL